jgi:hypothetical protein
MAWRPTWSLARVSGYAGTIAIPAWTLWTLAKGMFRNAIGYDEQFFMWGGWCILKGLAPYRDFIEFKPPMTFLSHALALRLFGYHGQHFRYFFMVLALVAVSSLLASLMSRGADRVLTSALGVAIAHLFAGPYHEAFFSDTESIGTSYYFLGVAFLIANTRHRKAAEIAGGVFMTLCALSKEPFAGCVVLTWVGCYFIVHGEVGRTSVVKYVKFTLAGVAVAVAALSLYMVPTGAMSAYLATLRSYAIMFRDPQKGYCVVLGRFHPQGFFADLPAQWSLLNGQFVNVATLAFLTPFFVTSLVFIPRRSWTLFGCALIAMVLAIYGVTVSNCYALHYYLMAQSGLFFFLLAGVVAIGPRLASANAGVRLWARSIFVASVAIAVWPQLADAVPFASNDTPPEEPAPGIFAFVREHSAPGDKIFSTGAPGFYVYVDRLPAVRESSIIDELIPSMPGNTDAEKLRPLYDELVKNQPKIVFLDPEHGNRKGRHLASAIMPFLSDYKYTKVNDQLYTRP